VSRRSRAARHFHDSGARVAIRARTANS
jgi:hypothetical protein